MSFLLQLWGGGGAPFVYDPATNTCKDTAGTTCRLLGAIPDVWDEVGQWGGKVAIASRTDEPSWARDLLCLFVTSSGQRLIDVVDPNLVEMCVQVVSLLYQRRPGAFFRSQNAFARAPVFIGSPRAHSSSSLFKGTRAAKRITFPTFKRSPAFHIPT